MVDPKKEYELLMRYLQGSTLKKESAAVPEQTYPEVWPVLPQPTPAATSPAVVYPKGKTHPVASRPIRKKQRVSWPKWQTFSVARRIRITIATLAILILAYFSWKGYYLYQLSSEEIFNKLYVLPANTQTSNTVIGRYYAAGNYVAVTLQSKKQPWLSDHEQLLTGLAYLQRSDYIKAIKWLEPAANNFKSSYRQEAEFYLALAYLKNEDYDRSIERMERMAYTPGHQYHDRITTRTLNDIKMLKWR